MIRIFWGFIFSFSADKPCAFMSVSPACLKKKIRSPLRGLVIPLSPVQRAAPVQSPPPSKFLFQDLAGGSSVRYSATRYPGPPAGAIQCVPLIARNTDQSKRRFLSGLPVIFVQPPQVEFDLPHIRRVERTEFQIDYDKAAKAAVIEDQVDVKSS